MQYEQLKLENRICFPVYAASRLITRQHQAQPGEADQSAPRPGRNDSWMFLSEER